jgi:hypothetical protein
MEELFDVLARQTPGEPLRIIGTVSAPTPALAVVYAGKTYDEFTYSEMRVFSRKAYHMVYAKSDLLDRRGRQ